MATIRLIPSTYYLSNSSYLSVANADNMYANTDSTNYATVRNSRTSTSSYYIYVRGFNFDAVPANAIINSFTIKLKGNYSGGYSQVMYLYDGTSTSFGSSERAFSSTVTTHTFEPTKSWENIVAAGSDFGIRINCRRNSRNTTAYIYIYGAEIEVDYTVPNPRTITTTLNGNGTIDPSGTTTCYDGDDFDLVIEPTNSSDAVTAKRDGSDITAQLVHHSAGSHTDNTVLGEYTLVSGGFNGSGATYFEGLEGKGVNNTKTTSNYYSSGSGTIAVFTYKLELPEIPNDATITRLYCQVNGHAESTSQSSEYMCVQLRSGNTELSDETNFKSVSTSNTTITLEAETLPTAAQLENLVLYCRLGYYGGAINGATCYIEYTTKEYYSYSFVVSGDTAIVVTIGSAGPSYTLYAKVNGVWKQATAVYVKRNGSWVEASDVLAKDNGTWK